MPTLRNVFACLVHERLDCVVDLVRNLRRLDPDSAVLLYDGSEDAGLLRRYPFERLDTVLHPHPRPMAWGELHGFALDSMRFCLAELPFDTLTIVDSDQIALRPGYSAYLEQFLRRREGIGLLSSLAAPQGPDSEVAPVKVAWREVDLWRPFLRRFEGGEGKFVHWTFWPSTVFTAAAARDLVHLFDTDTHLRELLARSKIWATEEVILPTLTALLGHRVERNPCCGDWVRFRTDYSPEQVETALAHPKAYWMHPVPRRWNHPVRARVRARYGGYRTDSTKGSRAETIPAPPPLLLTRPILDRMRGVEGWLSEAEADLLMAATAQLCRQSPPLRIALEVGSYCGRSTLVLGSVMRTLAPAARLVAVDPHDGRLGAADGELLIKPPSLDKLRRTLADAGLTERVQVIAKYALEVTWDQPIDLLFIDHLHDYASVAGDFFHFEPCLRQGSYVAFHDYAEYFPGVRILVDELLESGDYRKLQQVESLILLQRLSRTDAPPRTAAPPPPTVEKQPPEPRPHVPPAAVPRDRPAPQRETQDFAWFRGRHRGESMLVCGCGRSLTNLKDWFDPAVCPSIGVNDVGRCFDPDYLVVVNPRSQFKDDRFCFVAESRAHTLFTQLDLGPVRPPVVRFNLGRFGGTDFDDPNRLHYSQNSPYVALCLAAHMGASRIGLIGVDFTSDHFFAASGEHPLNKQLATIDRQYLRLYQALREAGIEVFNLSPISRLTAFPKLSPKEFVKQCAPPSGRESTPQSTSEPLRIVSYATTPVAGVPPILARCINAKTPHRARCVWARSDYGNGVVFHGDIEWERDPGQAEQVLAEADAVIVHNGKVAPEHRACLAGKAIVTLAHNYMWNVDQGFVDRGLPGLVVGQYQATLPEFKHWQPVPNPLPLWEEPFRPGFKGDRIGISYTPSGKHEAYPRGHRLYWHSKGYVTTLQVLDALAERYPLALQCIREQQVSHEQSLAMKRGTHIHIDECVTGSYHRNSLEALATGCVVVNGVGLLPGVEDLLRHCAEDPPRLPFVHAGLKDLESVLETLIASGSERLGADGKENRAWVERYWDFGRQWERFWWPALKRAREQVARPKRRRSPHVDKSCAEPLKASAPTAVHSRARRSVSVVIPHGGSERVPHLAATLRHLQGCHGVDEVILVDMGRAPTAREMAHEWGARYLCVHQDEVFERARALNIGSAVAAGDHVLWLDNDLLPNPDFIPNAIVEQDAQGLDFLLPYSSIRYLGQEDSRRVMEGSLEPAACIPVKIFRAGMVSGGAGLVRREFLLRHGGIPEEFRGWGGEDGAWWHKARLFGRCGSVRDPAQRLYHLYHPHSGGYGNRPREINPHYTRNLTLLDEIRRLRDAHHFLKRFPPMSRRSCPWPVERPIGMVRFPSPPAGWDSMIDSLAHTLTAWYGAAVVDWPWSGIDNDTEPPDCLVMPGRAAVKQGVGDPARPTLRARMLLVLDQGWEGTPTEREIARLAAGGALLADSPTEQRLRDAGAKQTFTSPNLLGLDDQDLARVFVGPISLVLAGACRRAS